MEGEEGERRERVGRERRGERRLLETSDESLCGGFITLFAGGVRALHIVSSLTTLLYNSHIQPSTLRSHTDSIYLNYSYIVCLVCG